jgi:hypothetical protein
VSFKFSVDGHDLHLKLSRNDDLLHPDYREHQVAADGTHTTRKNHRENCFYHGHVVGEKSAVAMGSCGINRHDRHTPERTADEIVAAGLRGMIKFANEHYYVLPVHNHFLPHPELDAHPTALPHLIYKVADTDMSGTCGGANQQGVLHNQPGDQPIPAGDGSANLERALESHIDSLNLDEGDMTNEGEEESRRLTSATATKTYTVAWAIANDDLMYDRFSYDTEVHTLDLVNQVALNYKNANFAKRKIVITLIEQRTWTASSPNHEHCMQWKYDELAMCRPAPVSALCKGSYQPSCQAEQSAWNNALLQNFANYRDRYWNPGPEPKCSDFGLTMNCLARDTWVANGYGFGTTILDAKKVCYEPIREFCETADLPATHDVAHFLTAIDFGGSTIGLAWMQQMGCTKSNLGVTKNNFWNVGINQWNDDNQCSAVLTHELGHNFGMDHDTGVTIIAPATSRFKEYSYGQGRWVYNKAPETNGTRCSTPLPLPAPVPPSALLFPPPRSCSPLPAPAHGPWSHISHLLLQGTTAASAELNALSPASSLTPFSAMDAPKIRWKHSRSAPRCGWISTCQMSNSTRLE